MLKRILPFLEERGQLSARDAQVAQGWEPPRTECPQSPGAWLVLIY